MMKLRLW